MMILRLLVCGYLPPRFVLFLRFGGVAIDHRVHIARRHVVEELDRRVIRVFKGLKNEGLAFPAFLDSVFIQQKIDPFPAFFLLAE